MTTATPMTPDPMTAARSSRPRAARDVPRHVLMPLPDRDFDATEVVVPWRLLTSRGYRVVFATERGGSAAACDQRTLDGALFDLFGAARDVRSAYGDLERDEAFRAPIAWDAIDADDYAGLWLCGGHAPGMRQYLDSALLQRKVAELWATGRPVAAICHGVLVLARARDPRSHKAVLSASRTTCLPKFAERGAYMATAWKLGRYYRTYDAYVEDEVCAALDNPAQQFERGPRVLDPRRIVRTHAGDGFVVEDGRYVSARWPADAEALGQRFIRLLDPEAAASAADEPSAAPARSPSIEPAASPAAALFSDIRQICTVTHDFERTVRNLVDQLGIGPFRCWHFRPPRLYDTTYRGAPERYSMKLALTWLDDMQWEVITPVHGRTLYRDHLDARGGSPGVQHLLMATGEHSWEAAGAHLAERGHPFGQTAKLNADVQIGPVSLPSLPNALAGPLALQFGYVDAEATLRTSIELTRYPLGFSERFALRSGKPERCVPEGNARFERSLPERRVGALVKVTIVTRDLDATIDSYIALAGVAPWRVFDVTPERSRHVDLGGGSSGVDARMAWGVIGNTVIELVQPRDDSGPYARVLAARGEGVSSVGVLAGRAGFDALCAHVEQLGYRRTMRGAPLVDTPAASYDARLHIGTDLEVLAPRDKSLLRRVLDSQPDALR